MKITLGGANDAAPVSAAEKGKTTKVRYYNRDTHVVADKDQRERKILHRMTEVDTAILWMMLVYVRRRLIWEPTLFPSMKGAFERKIGCMTDYHTTD